MNTRLPESRRVPRRVVASLVTAALLLQTVAPAFADVSQLPGIYIAPPDANVMFTLDDSLSMMSDTISDLDDNDTAATNALNAAGVPTGTSTNYYFDYFGRNFPNMWGTGSSYLTATLYDVNNKAARYLRSSAGNPLYYNPTVTYTPWPRSDNNALTYANASVTAVNIHPTDPFDTGSDSRRINLTTLVNGVWPAQYFVYIGTTALPIAKPNDALNVKANFIEYEIPGSGTTTFNRATTRTDCSGAFLPATGGCTRVEELQNFANWLQYFRSRMLMAKGGAALAFAQQGSNLRVGFATLNSSPIVRQSVAGFTGTTRKDFFDDLYSIPFSTQGTPLRQAMDAVGKYFQRSGAGSPWYDVSKTPNEFSCRKAFHILSTDGFWNNGTYSSQPTIGNQDDFTTGASPAPKTPSKPDGTQYTYSDTTTPDPNDPLKGRFTVNPFKDSVSNTLADVAAYYWKTDLRSDLANDVFPSDRDPAYWQHLTTFTVGLGIYGTGNVKARSTPDDAVGVTTDISTEANRTKLIKNRTPLPWPTPAEASPETGDDLIHAAMNGRGRYFSATNPTELSTSLASALAEATDRPTALASTASNSSSLNASSIVYLSTFSADQWYGRLYAFRQDPVTGAVNTKPNTIEQPNTTQLWEASNKMPAPASRNIYTFNPTGLGSLFKSGSLTTAQFTALNSDTTLIDYLRGSDARELAKGGPFRDRNRYTVNGVPGGVLGDVVNGSPIKGSDVGVGYDRMDPLLGSGQSTYQAFRTGTTLDTLKKTLFLGANDGMLHAFDLDTGIERFAYVPNSVFSVQATPAPAAAERRLQMLSDPAYSHRFSVDGAPNLADAYLSSAWKTVLIGSTGAGARSVFAMDVTNPEVGPPSGFGTSKILWEFSDTITVPTKGSADMGYMLSYPHVARMKNGKWAAIFGNGYDNKNDVAKLFIVDLETGALMKEISVGTATTAGADPTGINGLSQPNFVLNEYRMVETVYAGDLKGNLWKFDVSDINEANWKLSFAGSTAEPLFTARNASGQAQPIAVMPEISKHKNGGVIVSFGTGKLFETQDTATTSNVNLNIQSLYGIWDKPFETKGISGVRNTVLQQQTAPGSFSTGGLASSSQASVDWLTKRGWYIDLASGGERSNIIPQQVNNVLVMIANTPNVNPCGAGGTSKVFALDPMTGGKPTFEVFSPAGNVYYEAGGLLSFPIFQATDATAAQTDRGKTGTRVGGVETNRTTVSPKSCDQLFIAGLSNPAVRTLFMKTCVPGTPRISWRQLL